MTRVYLSGDPVHDRVLEAFYEGIEGKKELVRNWFRRQRQKNLDVIVLETGYINRGDGETHHYAAGFNGLNGRADFRNHDMPDDRAQKLGVELKPWRGGKHIILCGQVPWDASVENSDHKAWLTAAAERIRSYSNRSIVYRPHPMARQSIPFVPGTELSVQSLKDDLALAHCVVTYNSNTAVEALIDGVPVFAHDQGSMCWQVANKSLISVDVPNRPDRTEWLNSLAYAQWTLGEFRSGEAWRHLTK